MSLIQLVTFSLTYSSKYSLDPIAAHPRRPRGSQSGWEKRLDESFQVRVKEPMGTESHQTISKNSSRCRLLIGHKKCFVLLCPIGEQSLLSSYMSLYTTTIFSITACLDHAPKKCRQSGNFQFVEGLWNSLSFATRGPKLCSFLFQLAV